MSTKIKLTKAQVTFLEEVVQKEAFHGVYAVPGYKPAEKLKELGLITVQGMSRHFPTEAGKSELARLQAKVSP